MADPYLFDISEQIIPLFTKMDDLRKMVKAYRVNTPSKPLYIIEANMDPEKTSGRNTEKRVHILRQKEIKQLKRINPTVDRLRDRKYFRNTQIAGKIPVNSQSYTSIVEILGDVENQNLFRQVSRDIPHVDEITYIGQMELAGSFIEKGDESFKVLEDLNKLIKMHIIKNINWWNALSEPSVSVILNGRVAFNYENLAQVPKECAVFKSSSQFPSQSDNISNSNTTMSTDNTYEVIVNKAINEVISGEVKKQKPEIKKVLMDEYKKAVKELERSIPIRTFSIDGKILEKVQHQKFDTIINLMQTKEPLFLYGPAGSGKTRIAVEAAKALGLEYYSLSVNEQTTKTDFLGYYDASSRLVRTPFREAYEHGGVFIIDEIDAGNPNVLTVLNSALSNGFMSYPDGKVEAHPDFMVVSTANTTGDSQSLKYIGRNILDAATLDRFLRVYVDYDREMETLLLDERIIKVRDVLLNIIEDKGLDIFISTRSLFQLQSIAENSTKPLKWEEAIEIAISSNETLIQGFSEKNQGSK